MLQDNKEFKIILAFLETANMMSQYSNTVLKLDMTCKNDGIMHHSEASDCQNNGSLSNDKILKKSNG